MPGLARILSFSGTDPDSSIFRYTFGQFFGSRTDFTISCYSPGFYRFPVLTPILPFSVVLRIVFRFSQGFYLLPRLPLILSFSGTEHDSTIFRYSFEMFLGSRTDSTFSRYSHGFYRFSVLTLILPFFRTRSDSFSVLAQILPFPGTRPDSIIYRY